MRTSRGFAGLWGRRAGFFAAFLEWGVACSAGLLGCGGEAAAPSVEALCGRRCYQVGQAGCGARTQACISSCIDDAQAIPARCTSQRDAALRCLADATYACADDGSAEPRGCDKTLNALSECLGDQASVSGSPDASADAGAQRDAATDASSPAQDAAPPGGASDAGRDAGPDAALPGADAGAPSCSTVCANAYAAGCSEPGACGACEELRILTPTSCSGQLTALETCAASATFTCDPEGRAYAAACDMPSTAWRSCVEGVYPRAFGSADPSTAVCPGQPADACDQCLRTACCAPYLDCAADPECLALLTCSNVCTTTACQTSCDRAHPSAILLHRALIGCAVPNCTGSGC